jgi:hypothetical protein
MAGQPRQRQRVPNKQKESSLPKFKQNNVSNNSNNNEKKPKSIFCNHLGPKGIFIGIEGFPIGETLSFEVSFSKRFKP